MNKNLVYLNDCETSDLTEGLKYLLEAHGYQLTTNKQQAIFCISGQHHTGQFLKILQQYGEYIIYYTQKVHFFRGVSLLLQHRGEQAFSLEENPNFDSNGIMLDCSRNCVPTVETLKKQILRLAEFGMNRLYLYMEDTLEIEGYPYWGYLRGRYSKQEMQECDRYASLFGITLVPCIQTLAHLRSALKQPAFADYKDIDDILLLAEERSEQLLCALLKTVSECFSGGIVHLGMDEAAHLGRGKYLEKHGYQEPVKIMKRHLEWLTGECEKLGLASIIWSDMYFRLNFGIEDYYSLSEDAVPKSEENLSQKIALCYWDYYNEGVDFYKKYINLHRKLGNPMIFAGGAWTWNGVAPAISKAFKTTTDALDACIHTGIRDVFCTVWMDNGAEIPLAAMLPTLALYGEYGFSKRPTKEQIAERFTFCFGKDWEDYCLLDAFDNQQYEAGTTEQIFDLSNHNQYCENPSKTILYQDNLMGMFSKMFDEKALQKHYVWLAEKIAGIMHKDALDQEDQHLFSYYEALAKLLAKKAGITERIRSAYHVRDRAQLNAITAQELGEISNLAEKLGVHRQSLWMDTYKPFGYELLDIRLAGVAARAKSAANRITAFLAGEVSALPELEEEILPYKTAEMLEKEVLHGYYLWEKIISAGNIDGV